MRARKPEFDFSKTLPLWTNHREFSQLFNAFSVIIMELEPFMNRVMRRVKEELDEDDPLRQDVDMFIRQEANHTLLHRAYNQALYSAGYDELKGLEEALKQDYSRFLAEWPLRDLVAYCEGFEVLGPLMAELFYEQIDDVLEGADSEVVDLWKWHLAEEYEHRMVAFNAYHRLGGNWLHRLSTLRSTLRHLGSYRKKINCYLLKVDRETMTPEQVNESRAAMQQLGERLRWFMIKRLLRILSPFYSPARVPMPRGVAHYLNG